MNKLLLFLLLGFYFVNPANAEDDDKPTSKLPFAEKQNVLVLDDNAQQISGIQTTPIKPVNFQNEYATYGKVLSIQPLLVLRQRYFQSLFERKTASAKFSQSEQNRSRQQTLFNNGISSRHSLENQQAQYQIDKAQLEANRFVDKAISEEALLTWGKVLGSWALASHNETIDALISGDNKLVKIIIPSNKQLPDSIRRIAVEASGNRNKAVSAHFVSIAPETDSSTQGVAYFFQVSSKELHPGMNISAWIPEQDEQQSGFIIPKSALIWSMGQAFVYIRYDGKKFSRQLIEHYTETAEGYFVGNVLNPNTELVITGGQMLLSEELRGQIPDEDD